MDATTREYFRRRPLLTQNLLWELQLQGKRIELKTHLSDYTIPPRPKRNAIASFSQRSRMRLLKKIASVDWSHRGKGLLVTFTYPDECAFDPSRDLTTQKYLIHRFMEKHLGREISLIWRVEWKARLSGKFAGSIAPHIHMIVFNVAWFPHEVLMPFWAKCIGHDGWCDVWLDKLDDDEKALVYVSKYAAKVPETVLLIKGHKSTMCGRHWGTKRESGIPWAQKVTFIVPDFNVAEKLEALQRTFRSDYDILQDCGFTMLGRRATDMRAKISAIMLDAGILPMYN